MLRAMCSCFICSSSSSVEVRWAMAADRPAVSDLVTGLRLGGTLLRDLDAYYETCRERKVSFRDKKVKDSRTTKMTVK